MHWLSIKKGPSQLPSGVQLSNSWAIIQPKYIYVGCTDTLQQLRKTIGLTGLSVAWLFKNRTLVGYLSMRNYVCACAGSSVWAGVANAVIIPGIHCSEGWRQGKKDQWPGSNPGHTLYRRASARATGPSRKSFIPHRPLYWSQVCRYPATA